MPILSASVFDNTGKIYDVSKILTPDYIFDKDAYENYSRVFLPITYVLSYALQFAALSALIVHTGLWHGKDISSPIGIRLLPMASSGPRILQRLVRLDTYSLPHLRLLYHRTRLR